MSISISTESANTMQDSNDLSICPSFNSYSADRSADIAARVSDECTASSKNVQNDTVGLSNGPDNDHDEDFEFALADEIYYDGQFRPIFPIFNRDLLLQDDEHHSHEIAPSDDASSIIRIPLKSLFLEDRDPPLQTSCSSSDADEVECMPPGTYCVWRPKKIESSPSRCKKSNSTGSGSKRWRLRDLLRRSNSDGKDSFVFLTPKHRHDKNEKAAESSKEKPHTGDGKMAGKAKVYSGNKKKSSSSSAHEAFYVRNRALKEGDKRKSYLPYRKDLLGFFANVHGMGRTFRPL